MGFSVLVMLPLVGVVSASVSPKRLGTPRVGLVLQLPRGGVSGPEQVSGNEENQPGRKWEVGIREEERLRHRRGGGSIRGGRKQRLGSCSGTRGAGSTPRPERALSAGTLRTLFLKNMAWVFADGRNDAHGRVHSFRRQK